MIGEAFKNAARTLALSDASTLSDRVLESYLLNLVNTDPEQLPTYDLAQRFSALRRRLSLAHPDLLSAGAGGRGPPKRSLTDEEAQAMARTIVEIADALGAKP